MGVNKIRKTHLYQDNAGKAFKNGAVGKVANTVCEANYRAEGLVTTAAIAQVTCINCLRKLATGERRSNESHDLPPAPSLGLRNALFDPVVLAALLGLIGAGVGAAISNIASRNSEVSRARCERAFTFLQDEAINTRLETNDAFYQMQLGIAERCSRSAE